MKIKTEYEIEAREIPEMISGVINNLGQFYELYTHINEAEASRQTHKEDKSPLCEYYIDNESHKVYKLEALIYKLIREGKIQPDITK